MAHYCSKIFRVFVLWSHITTFGNLKFFGSKNWFDLTWSVRTKYIVQFTIQPPSNSFNSDVIFAIPKMRNLNKSGTLKLLQQFFPLNTVLRDSFFVNGTKSAGFRKIIYSILREEIFKIFKTIHRFILESWVIWYSCQIRTLCCIYFLL